MAGSKCVRFANVGQTWILCKCKCRLSEITQNLHIQTERLHQSESVCEGVCILITAYTHITPNSFLSKLCFSVYCMVWGVDRLHTGFWMQVLLAYFVCLRTKNVKCHKLLSSGCYAPPLHMYNAITDKIKNILILQHFSFLKGSNASMKIFNVFEGL